MKPGQKLTQWFQRYVLGELKTPQDIYRASVEEVSTAADNDRRFLSTPEPSPFWDAPERLKALAHFHSASFLRQQDRADWQHADPRFMRWAALFIEYARKRGIPLYVHSCFRTEAEQQELVRKRVSKTPYPRSAHNTAQAVDIVHGTLHWELTVHEWSLLHVLGCLALERVNAELPKDKKLRLTWGGHWSFYDPAHWELTDYRDRIQRLPVGLPVRYTPRGILARFKL